MAQFIYVTIPYNEIHLDACPIRAVEQWVAVGEFVGWNVHKGYVLTGISTDQKSGKQVRSSFWGGILSNLCPSLFVLVSLLFVVCRYCTYLVHNKYRYIFLFHFFLILSKKTHFVIEPLVV